MGKVLKFYNKSQLAIIASLKHYESLSKYDQKVMLINLEIKLSKTMTPSAVKVSLNIFRAGLKTVLDCDMI